MTTDKGTKTMSASLYFYVLLKIYCKTTVASSPSNKDSAGEIRLIKQMITQGDHNGSTWAT